ncbi:hypothetical protein PC129_g3907 [Phytophthora cactorum]|uniref:Uncharacterized protein n=1 Tax=Phytophthora cactorum TaxID=29920 RepID=A0A8T1IN26_9STRA|nr:hypothetical protein Pcac1_g3508 [Phytophthora cactorum]KAG2834807.1 hypothetical protein PC112_g5923 [Phytophthora cactorum]KAG2844426.1 hypothetical protein PC111_g1969 [Phytophthora cactorum]KAG2863063.1 hypothetical protein PC113_g5748 [Phytophthora cactorum]KAG2920646.1 hypothetical protein PC114_g6013 [Phytophthora cactorum]
MCTEVNSLLAKVKLTRECLRFKRNIWDRTFMNFVKNGEFVLEIVAAARLEQPLVDQTDFSYDLQVANKLSVHDDLLQQSAIAGIQAEIAKMMRVFNNACVLPNEVLTQFAGRVEAAAGGVTSALLAFQNLIAGAVEEKLVAYEARVQERERALAESFSQREQQMNRMRLGFAERETREAAFRGSMRVCESHEYALMDKMRAARSAFIISIGASD